MSKQVDFYLIKNPIKDSKYKFASHLANKLSKLKKSTLIVTQNAESSQMLDSVMWSFSDTSFLSHDFINASQTTEQPTVNSIQIGNVDDIAQLSALDNFQVLINLAEQVPVFVHHFTRIAEIIEAEDTEKKLGRQRYSDYQQQGFALKTHPVEL